MQFLCPQKRSVSKNETLALPSISLFETLSLLFSFFPPTPSVRFWWFGINLAHKNEMY
jgi:hypothetical protein